MKMQARPGLPDLICSTDARRVLPLVSDQYECRGAIQLVPLQEDGNGVPDCDHDLSLSSSADG